MQVPLWRTLRRGPAIPHCSLCCGWPPRVVLMCMAMGVSDFWVLDMQRLGPLLHTRASPMASPAISASSAVFFTCCGFSLYFGFAFLYFEFALCFGFDFRMHFGLWVPFWEDCSGFLAGFGGFVGLGCFRGRFGCLMETSFVFWALGVMGALCGFQVLGLILVGLFGYFPFVGWLWWFLCILLVYLRVPYVF
jgi:hypothetical protein